MEKIIAAPFKVAMFLVIMTITATFCVAFANAYLLPGLVEASYTLSQVNWYGVSKLFQEFLKYTIFIVVLLLILKYFMNLGKKPATKPSGS